MWFFGAYQPARTTIKRHVDAATSGIATANTHDTTQKQEVQYLSGNVTNQFGNKLRTRVAYNNSWSKTTGLLAGAERRRSGDHQLHQRHDVPELGDLGHGRLHRQPEVPGRRRAPAATSPT